MCSGVFLMSRLPLRGGHGQLGLAWENVSVLTNNKILSTVLSRFKSSKGAKIYICLWTEFLLNGVEMPSHPKKQIVSKTTNSQVHSFKPVCKMLVKFQGMVGILRCSTVGGDFEVWLEGGGKPA